MEEKKLQEAAKQIVSAIATPSLELADDNLEKALNRVRVLVKAELEKRKERRWTISASEMHEMWDLRERCRRGEIDPRDVYF